MGISNELSCEVGTFSCCCNPHRFFQSEVLRLYFTLVEPWVAQYVWLPSYSSWFICMQMWGGRSTSHHLTCPSPSAADWLGVLSIWLPTSAPPTGLDECFFNSLVVRPPCSSIVCQFWLFFVFKCFVVHVLVVRGGILSIYASILARSSHHLFFMVNNILELLCYHHTLFL